MKKRVFVERKAGFTIERDQIFYDLKENFNIKLDSLRYFLVYDLFNVEEDLFGHIKNEILSESNRDILTDTINLDNHVISYEFLPGQFDQRADSAMQCAKLIDPTTQVIIKSGTVITFDETVSEMETQAIKKYLINSVESREKNLNVLSLEDTREPDEVPVIKDFIKCTSDDLKSLHDSLSLAMSFEDLVFIQEYFRDEEKRNPYLTEIKVLDTYWSDHCRHTTFETEIRNTVFSLDKLSHQIEDTFKDYLETKSNLGRINKPITLMDLATINARYERTNKNLKDLEVSEEINAASIYIDVDVDGKTEKWLLMFKNETHNHPTEIEPFGGASTCIGGAIRDPLSGRSYVYAAMRVTGASDITEDVSKTMEGKLPQKVISKGAAHGYSSYGNQIGLPTTHVREIYHPGYKAKRMEIGAVVGAAPLSHVRRETPLPGDVVILLGGRTGRDGIGGATGSSKTHNKQSIETSSAEVQKGNAPEERKIQRLFRNNKVTSLIKKSNDFGAGGVSVAIGELADGININLDLVPTKYDGINGTELAISESQERMAVVVEEKDQKMFLKYCEEENIEAVPVAIITKEKRLVMTWKGNTICDMSRDFIDTSGVRQKADVEVVKIKKKKPFEPLYKGNTLKEKLSSLLQDINVSSQQGLVEMFDSTIGRTTVFAPFGGKYQLTQTQSSVHKIPVLNGKTNTVSIMTYGYNPYISEWSQYHGSQYAIIESMAKNVATGGYYKNIRFTFQEYFERLYKNEQKWAKPFTALLGAYKALKEFRLAAIGGKDSMSGTYHSIDVPPTLVSFAVNTENVNNVISNELKQAGNYLYLFKHTPNKMDLPDYEQLHENFESIYRYIQNKDIVTAYALEYGGLAEALIKSSFGNKIGVDVTTVLPLTKFDYGSILVESSVKLKNENAIYLGRTIEESVLYINDARLDIDHVIELSQKKLTTVFPIIHEDKRKMPTKSKKVKAKSYQVDPVKQVNVLIPVFPGTNCEYDSQQAFVDAGANVDIMVFNNMSEKHINKSIDTFVEKMKDTHILMFAGGFSSGDEPDGSGKFIASVLRNKKVASSIESHLKHKRLILGICNGFQALVKAGLLPYGTVQEIKEDSPTLFKNSINRHISKFVNTKVSSINSPWLSSFSIGDTHTIPMSHGEGKFIINEEGYEDLVNHGQIAFQYVDEQNNPTYNPNYNPNGSSYAIEGIVSKDGLILGKMGHSERYDKDLFKNINGQKTQNIFLNAVKYFKGEQ
jgi:phosphoribosylformylglycinamidine synthase